MINLRDRPGSYWQTDLKGVGVATTFFHVGERVPPGNASAIKDLRPDP